MFPKHLLVYLSEICLYICDQLLFCCQLYMLISTVCNVYPSPIDYIKVFFVSTSQLILKSPRIIILLSGMMLLNISAIA